MSTCVLNQELRRFGGRHCVSLPVLKPTLLREEEEEETIKNFEKIHSGIIRVMVLMNQNKGFIVFLI